MKNRKENKKNAGFLAVLLLLVFVGIGYATLTKTLNINGTTNVTSQTWDVHFNNVANKNATGDAVATREPSISDSSASSTNDLVTYAVSFTKPGDTYSFTVDVENFGSIPATVAVDFTTLATSGNDSAVGDWLEYKVNNSAEGSLDLGRLEKAGAANHVKTITVTVSMKNKESLPTGDVANALHNVALNVRIVATQTNASAS